MLSMREPTVRELNGGPWSPAPAKSRKKTLSFRLTLEELRILEREARRRDVSLSDLVRQALAGHVGAGQ